jgi:hypothetical protein
MVAPAAYQNGPDTPYLYATLELCSSVAAHVLRRRHARAQPRRPGHFRPLLSRELSARGAGALDSELLVLRRQVLLYSSREAESRAVPVGDDVRGNQARLDRAPGRVELRRERGGQRARGSAVTRAPQARPNEAHTCSLLLRVPAKW